MVEFIHLSAVLGIPFGGALSYIFVSKEGNNQRKGSWFRWLLTAVLALPIMSIVAGFFMSFINLLSDVFILVYAILIFIIAAKGVAIIFEEDEEMDNEDVEPLGFLISTAIVMIPVYFGLSLVVLLSGGPGLLLLNYLEPNRMFRDYMVYGMGFGILTLLVSFGIYLQLPDKISTLRISSTMSWLDVLKQNWIYSIGLFNFWLILYGFVPPFGVTDLLLFAIGSIVGGGGFGGTVYVKRYRDARRKARRKADKAIKAARSDRQTVDDSSESDGSIKSEEFLQEASTAFENNNYSRAEEYAVRASRAVEIELGYFETKQLQEANAATCEELATLLDEMQADEVSEDSLEEIEQALKAGRLSKAEDHLDKHNNRAQDRSETLTELLEQIQTAQDLFDAAKESIEDEAYSEANETLQRTHKTYTEALKYAQRKDELEIADGIHHAITRVEEATERVNRLQTKARMEQAVEDGDDYREVAQEFVDQDKFKDAIQMLEEARECYRQADNLASEFEFPERDQIGTELQRISREIEDCRLGKLRKRIRRVDRNIDMVPREAQKSFERLLSELEESEIDRSDELDELHDRVQRGIIESKIEQSREYIEQAQQYEPDEFEEAIQSLENAQEHYDDAVNRAAEFDINKTGKLQTKLQNVVQEIVDCRIATFEQRTQATRERIETEPQQTLEVFEDLLSELDQTDIDRPNEVAELRERIQSGIVQSKIEQCRNRIDEAEQQFEDEEYYDARQELEVIQEDLEQVLSTARKHGLEDQQAELRSLIQVCTTNADEARRALYGTGDTGTEFRSITETPTLTANSRPLEETGLSVDIPDTELREELPDHQVMERIGSGGNADVYKVRLESSDEVLALKVPRWEGTLSVGIIDQFVEEAKTWVALDDHVNIIKVRDWGTTPYPWMLMEYMDGGNLSERIGELNEATGISNLIAVCEAVNHAHRHGVAHTDLKPPNILFDDEEGSNVKVGDWGLAKVLIKHSGSIEGLTPTYAAPEQIDSEQYGSPDDYTDIYQIGIMIYETLTGQVPFDKSSHAATVNAILEQTPDPPSQITDSLPEAIDDIVQRAVAKRKEDRYETVLYLRDDLQELQKNWSL